MTHNNERIESDEERKTERERFWYCLLYSISMSLVVNKLQHLNHLVICMSKVRASE